MARKKTVKSPTRSARPAASKRTGKAKPARPSKAKKPATGKRASAAIKNKKKTTRKVAGKKTTTRKASPAKLKASAKSASRSRTQSSKGKASRATAKTKKVARSKAKKRVRKTAKKVTSKAAKRVTKKTPKRSPAKAVRKSAKKAASVKRTSRTASRAKKKPTVARKTSPRRSVKKTERSKSNRPLSFPSKTSKKSPAVHPPASAQDPIQFVEEIKPPRTRLTDGQLESFKQLLLSKRRELDGDVRNLTRDARSGGGGSDHAHMPIHMADVGSDNWEHEFTLGLIENEHNRIRMIDEALLRVAERTYGICAATGKKIGMARLRAKPWAKYCIEYARAREEGRIL